jgi:hypothetical protein
MSQQRVGSSWLQGNDGQIHWKKVATREGMIAVAFPGYSATSHLQRKFPDPEEWTLNIAGQARQEQVVTRVMDVSQEFSASTLFFERCALHLIAMKQENAVVASPDTQVPSLTDLLDSFVVSESR